MKKRIILLIFLSVFLSCNKKEGNIFISKLHASNKKSGKIMIRSSQKVRLHSAIKNKKRKGNNYKVKIRKNLVGSEK